MRVRVVLAVAAVALLPAAVFAVPRPPEPRLHPRDTASVPTYVQRVEPASSAKISVCPAYENPARCIAVLFSGAETIASIIPARANRAASRV